MQHVRGDGTTYITARTTAGTYVVLGQSGSYRTRREAVEIGKHGAPHDPPFIAGLCDDGCDA